MDAFRARLVRFYEAYAPEKLGDVDRLAQKASGSSQAQRQLICMLVEKYGPEPMASDPVGLKRRVFNFYSHYNPAKIGQVDDLVRRTKGKANYEERLMAMLLEKYDVEEEPGSPAGSVAQDASSDVKEPLKVGDEGFEEDSDDEDDKKYSIRARVTRFYQVYAPAKLVDVDKLVEKTKEDPRLEEQLIKKLTEKYGPEPDTEDEGEEGEEEEEEITKFGNQEGAGAGQEDAKVGEMVHEKTDSLLRDIVYCPIDGMPPEYSEYLPTFKAALPWLEEHFPSLVLTTQGGKTVEQYMQKSRDAGEEGAALESKNKRGGAGLPNKQMAAKKSGQQQGVTIERSHRQKRKYVTSILGLDSYDVKLKDAAKKLGRRLACGASVNKTPTGQQAIDIQGDVIYDLPDLLLEYFPQVDKSKITLINEGKKTKAFPS